MHATFVIAIALRRFAATAASTRARFRAAEKT
jgi:hypothetical protein